MKLLCCVITFDAMVAAMVNGAVGHMIHMQSYELLSIGVHLGPLLPPDIFSSFALLACFQGDEVDASLENVVRLIMACCAFTSPCKCEGYPASPSAPARLDTATAPAWPMARDSRKEGYE